MTISILLLIVFGLWTAFLSTACLSYADTLRFRAWSAGCFLLAALLILKQFVYLFAV
jgi:hypothetical protein